MRNGAYRAFETVWRVPSRAAKVLLRTNVAESWSIVLGAWLDKRGRAGTVSYRSLAVPSLYYEALGVLKPIWDKAQASLAQQETALTKQFLDLGSYFDLD